MAHGGLNSLNLLEEQNWFHGDLSNRDTKFLLDNTGDFLVRRNPKNKEFVASYLSEDRQHVDIVLSKVGWSPDGHSSSSGIQSLVKILCDKSKLKTPIIRNEWKLRHEDILFSMNDKIGEGNFAIVYKARYKNKDVAVKIYRGTTSGNKHEEEMRKRFLLEGFILGRNNHRNIVEFIGIAINKNTMMIVTEYVEGGDLLHFLEKKEGPFLLKELLSMCKDVATGMAYLERKKCFHRDLAARNCLVKPNGSSHIIVKISDFGMSRLEKCSGFSDSGPLPFKWTALEVLNGEPHTSKSDVWSFGILMWEIFSKGKTPYSDRRCASLIDCLNHGYRLEPPEETPRQCKDLMQNCWNSNPDERYDFKTIREELKSIYRNTDNSMDY